jgi:nucleoside-diphosphate-sugar epimerase
MGKSLTINGDGNDALDFTYIEDLTQGVILTIQKKEAINEVFNITYGGARKLNQLAEIVQAEFPSIDISYKPRDGLMPERGTLNIDKARSLLGYEPKYPIEKGFVKYIQWYKTFLEKNPLAFKAN